MRSTLDDPTRVDVAGLWEEPVDLAERDLFYGPGGRELMPDAAMAFVFVKEDTSGFSGGYDVRDLDGQLWSVKLGPEAQPEVVASRVLWALGYHQLPTYYLPAWEMAQSSADPQPPGRFRAELGTWQEVGEWSWYENEFATTQPFKGLVVVNLLLNNWDWKTSNNRMYEVERPEGASPRRVYMVRDIGASLGRIAFPTFLTWLPFRGLGQGTRNDLEGFESQGFIRSVEDGDDLDFYYQGIDEALVDSLSPGDVVWACELMSRLSDDQWHDAFRAAGYDDERTRRYVAKIKSKIAEGLKLARG